MHHVGFAELAAAVSNAGGLGIITGLTQPTPVNLGQEIARCHDMTDMPFGVNLTFLPTFEEPPYEGYIEEIIKGGVKIVETAGRNPEPYLPMLKEAGIKVIHKCTSVRHSVKAEAIGCDAVSIDGFECAGHPGEDDIPALVLIPATADKVKIPLVASGGFADGRGLAAALALGAEGINMGTRFMVTEEAPIHPEIKQVLVDADERDTALIMRSQRNTGRVYRNSVADRVIEIEATGEATMAELGPLVSGQKGRQVLEQAEIDKGLLYAGMVVGIINDVPTCKDLVERIVAEAEAIINQRMVAAVA
jgi:nitronate monooxygenase